MTVLTFDWLNKLMLLKRVEAKEVETYQVWVKPHTETNGTIDHTWNKRTGLVFSMSKKPCTWSFTTVSNIEISLIFINELSAYFSTGECSLRGPFAEILALCYDHDTPRCILVSSSMMRLFGIELYWNSLKQTWWKNINNKLTWWAKQQLIQVTINIQHHDNFALELKNLTF